MGPLCQGRHAVGGKVRGAAWQLNHYGECGDHLAQIYEKTGRAEKAAQMYAMALQAKHSYPEAASI